MMAEKPSPQAFDIEAHLHHIVRRFGEIGRPALVEIVSLSAADEASVKHVARYRPDQITQAADDAAGLNAAGYNLYVTVNPVNGLKIPPAGKRASREHILGSFFHFADADSQEAASNIANFVGPKCTMSVLTGSVPHERPHVYWELEQFETDLPAWERRQKAIAATLRTDSAVTDAPRIMRLGGTVNWPKPAKQAKGYIAQRTSLTVYSAEERPPVSAERMARAFAGAGAASAPQALSASMLDLNLADQRKTADHYADILRRCRTDGEKHGGVRDLSAFLAGSGVARLAAEAMVREACPVWDAGVEKLLDTAYDKFAPQGQAAFAPNFDYAPASTPSDPAPAAPSWQMQSAADFTAGFVAPEYIVDGVVQRGRLYTLTAPTGSGKTAVMLYAAIAVAQGDLFYDREVEQGDVIFMAGENPDDVRARMIATMEFYGIDPARCRVHFIPGTFSIRDDMERIRAAAATLPNLVLVVIDTFAAYFDGDDENSNAQAIDFARVARKLTAFPSKPAVVMPAHPVKNATRGNLAPKGGSSLVNEVDGNLTLWNEGGVVTLHWQVKFRGAEFEPLNFELQRYETDLIRDAKGRRMPTILAKPMLQTRAMQIASENLSIEDKLLLSIHDNPALSLAERAVQVGLNHKQKVSRCLVKLVGQKLIRKFRTNWELTREGERAVEMIQSGDRFAPEI